MDRTRVKPAPFICVAPGLYRKSGHFYRRFTLPNGRRTFRAVDGHTIKSASTNLARIITTQHTGNGESSLTVAQALADYLKHGCPDKRRSPRTGRYLSQEQARVKTLAQYWSTFRCSNLTVAALDDFADWRIKHRRKKHFHGGRAADLDINTLKSALRWVSRRGLLAHNPFALIKLSSYRKASIRHCREVAPRSGDELHALAAHLFENPASAVFGWLTLITAMVGLRVSEIVQLRLDAREGEPGHIGDGILWLRRAKKGTHNYFRIHPALQTCLDQFFLWRHALKREKKPLKSPWWFPGRNPILPVQESSLSHALNRAGRLLFKEARTAHGLRSFYVTVRRSMGAADAEIALELGQISGGREIVRTYGEATPKKVSWLPQEGTPPAWEQV